MSSAQPDTYFIIKMWVDKIESEYGPYLGLNAAVELLVNHIPLIASAKSKRKKFNYKAEVYECLIGENGEWDLMSTQITENSCRRMKIVR